MQEQCNKLNFKGQPIFIGIDVARKSWRTCILTQSLEHKTFNQPPYPEVLVHYLHRNFPGAKYFCVYEAGFSGFWIHDRFKELGINCLVVNPADVPSKQKEKVHKTDRVDARKLAHHLRNGQLEPIYVPSQKDVENRALVRMRYSFVKKQTRCRNQIKALLYFYGIPVPKGIGERYWSKRFTSWLNGITTLQDSGTEAIKALLRELMWLREVITNLNRKIRILSKDPIYQKRVQLLMTIPGISILTAMVILTELIDIHRFSALDQLACYFGLVPGEHSSGDKTIITGLSSRRNPFLRSLIIESSWIAVRKDPALIQSFENLCKRMPKSKAIIRIARKLINRIRYVLKHQQPYLSCVVGTST